VSQSPLKRLPPGPRSLRTYPAAGPVVGAGCTGDCGDRLCRSRRWSGSHRVRGRCGLAPLLDRWWEPVAPATAAIGCAAVAA